ncbi:MAG: hypothetical protein SVO01_00055 [Thermotogota bacterium]|nr:hypothetical protein [Thermotogota bacterium]
MSGKQDKKLRKELRNQMPVNQRIQIKREDLKILTCSNPECNSTIFTETFELGLYSALISPTGKDEVIKMTRNVCIKCGHLPQDPNKPKEGGEKKIVEG